MVSHRGPEYAALLGRVSEKLRPLFGTAGEVVTLGSSGTGGLEAAVTSAFSPGQKLLACPVGVFGKRLATIARTWGLEVEVLETELGSALDPAALEARLRADAKHEIAGILLTHNETSTGVQNDMAALAAAIGDHPATTIVDSVDGLGASQFEMDRWGFSVVVTASQKALSVPPGVAMVAVSPRGWEHIGIAKGPRFYFDLAKAREFARDGQTPWTPPVSIVYALDVALDRYHREGAAAVWARHARNAEAIRAFAQAAQLEVFSKPDAHSVTVVRAARAPEGIVTGDVLRELRDQHGLIFGGGPGELKGKIFRIGTMGAITTDDLLQALDTFESVLIAKGHRSERGAGAAAARSVFGEVATTR